MECHSGMELLVAVVIVIVIHSLGGMRVCIVC